MYVKMYDIASINASKTKLVMMLYAFMLYIVYITVYHVYAEICSKWSFVHCRSSGPDGWAQNEEIVHIRQVSPRPSVAMNRWDAFHMGMDQVTYEIP